MNEYGPDKWMLVRIEAKGKFHYRLFGTWAGGYLHGDSWRMNSGITSVTKVEEDFYAVSGYSGSVYYVRKDMYGSTAYGYSVLASYQAQSNDEQKFIVIQDEPSEEELSNFVWEGEL